MTMSFGDKLKNYIGSGHPVIAVETPEEGRIYQEISQVAKAVKADVWSWKVSTGATKTSNGQREHLDVRDPADVLEAIHDKARQDKVATIWVLQDFTLYLDQNPYIQRWLRDCACVFKTLGVYIVLIDPVLRVPDTVKDEVVFIDYPLPDTRQLQSILDAVTSSAAPSHKTKISDEKREKLLLAAKGMSSWAAENAFALSLYTESTYNHLLVAAEKAAFVKKSGLLDLHQPGDLSKVGGLESLKAWLSKRQHAFGPDAQAYGLDIPKGILAVGVPGCGKSETAKACAGLWERPLIRLDVGRCFAGIVGESEANLREVFRIVEGVAPCVLWLDEIEKAFAGAKNSLDSGVTSRIFGSFIHWMQEKTAPVFIFATANDVESLPPELLRKGRFDEIFFIDLPTASERAVIWTIHLERRGRKPKHFQIDALVNLSEGFSGAEIEQAVKEALYSAFDDGQREPCQADLVSAIKETVPLSKTRGEDIRKLRAWASERARPASVNHEAPPPAGRKIRS